MGVKQIAKSTTASGTARSLLHVSLHPSPHQPPVDGEKGHDHHQHWHQVLEQLPGNEGRYRHEQQGAGRLGGRYRPGRRQVAVHA